MPIWMATRRPMRIGQAERGTDRHIPIVALTANALTSEKERCLASGMDEYLSKPLRESGLMDMLQKFPTSNVC
jgi:two-component system, sensor histidine kinase and response regulator